MDSVLWALIGIIVLFLLGNLALELTKPKRRFSTTVVSTQVLSDPSVVTASLLALHNKIALLSDQVNQHESILVQIPVSALKERFDTSDLQQRVDRLYDFKNNAEIEIVAMRDALIAKGLLKSKSNTIDQAMESEIKARVFNSRKK
ncbi:MAG: hypothetical protein Q7R47_03375 [Candidatus Diapherotrites archaeon]|nr:hypothetical protein [Candidatus Diapherotrites archaeon]